VCFQKLAFLEAEKDAILREKDRALADLQDLVKNHAAEKTALEDLAAARVKEAERSVREAMAAVPTTACPTSASCPKARVGAAAVLPVVVRNNSTIFEKSKATRLRAPKDSLAIHIVTHVHWDREWYRSLEHFNRLLATVLDNVVEALTTPASGLNHFHLDAQAILVEDYLRARPHHKALLRQLSEADQFGAGPWYTQPDEFLVSGEALVRNLLYGIATLAELGMGFVPIGHVPDQFGHTSQMPQIFLQFGMVAAASMRGVPNEARRNSWWEGPDGSRILLLKFSNYCGMQFDASSVSGSKRKKRASLMLQVEQQLKRRQEKDQSENITTLYWLNGCDHRDLDREVGPAIERAQAAVGGTKRVQFGSREMQIREVVSSNLRDVALLVLDELKSNNFSLPVLRGELRRDVDHLADTVSSGSSLKRLNWASEELLQSWAEPLNVAALLQSAGRDESFEIVRAWKMVLENHFHDTICTTSVPQVLVEARVRAERAIQIAEAISSQFMFALMEKVIPVNVEAVFVFNPTNVARNSELVVLWMAIPRSVVIDPGQILTVTDPLTKQRFNATAVTHDSNLWRYRHRRGGFRTGHTFNMLRVAMRPPLVRPNEMRVFHVSLNPEYGPPVPRETTEPHKRRRPKKVPPPEEQGKKEEEPSDGAPKTLGRFGNKRLECELLPDGSVLVASKTGLFNDVPRLNMIMVQEDFGSQYLAQFGNQISPINVEDVKITRTADFEMVSFWLRGRNLAGSQQTPNPSPLAAKEEPRGQYNFEISVHYVLPEDSNQLWVRVAMAHPEGGNRNFALRVGHKLSCPVTDMVHDTAFDHLHRSRQSMPDTKPFHKWFLAHGTNCSLGVAGRGLYDSRIEGESMPTTTLMRAVDRMGDWATFKNEGAQDFGFHEWEYAVVPLGATADPEAMALEGRRFASEGCAVQHVDQGLLPQVMTTCVSSSHLRKLSAHAPPFASGEPFVGDDDTAGGLFGDSAGIGNTMVISKLPAYSMMGGATLAPEALVLSAVKRAHYDPEAFVVRLYNPTGKEIEGVLTLQFPIASAFHSRLDEQKQSEVEMGGSDTVIKLTVEPKKIVSLLVYPKR
jgi:alpha-mannosidase